MTERTLIAAAGGLIAAFIVLVGGWLIVTAYAVISWQIPLAAGFAVFMALWTVDFLSEQVEKRNAPKP